MTIHGDFEGGNIRVLSMAGDEIHLANDLRDNAFDWFYWAFCVRGAKGRRLRFCFDETRRVGPWGAAMSTDQAHWQWSGGREAQGEGFSCVIPEDCVYFCHHMRYTPARFEALAKELGLERQTFARTLRGRDVPIYHLGSGERNLLLTARHHACEDTGNAVLEGMVRSLAAQPLQGMKLTVVPFVDYDGVLDGDQGKGRAPYDHNRAYRDDTRYDVCRQLMTLQPEAAIDFHSPNHCGGRSDTCYLVSGHTTDPAKIAAFSGLLQEKTAQLPLRYHPENDMPPNTGWNSADNENFGRWFGAHTRLRLACTLETTYFGTEEEMFTQARAVELGKGVGDALRTLLTRYEDSEEGNA